MKRFNVKEIIKNLIGQIEPCGDSSRDDERLENLKETCQLVRDLIAEIKMVETNNSHSHEYSVKRSADYAGKFLDEIAHELI